MTTDDGVTLYTNLIRPPRMETGRRYAMQAEKISPIYSQAFQGGFKEALPELPDIGGML